MRRQQRQSSPLILSPTTTAAKAGIMLNDPSLAFSSSTAVPGNANVSGAFSGNTLLGHTRSNNGLSDSSSSNALVCGDCHSASTMTSPSQGTLPPHTVVRTAIITNNTHVDKENNNVSMVSRQLDKKTAAAALTEKEDEPETMVDELKCFCDDEESASSRREGARIKMIHDDVSRHHCPENYSLGGGRNVVDESVGGVHRLRYDAQESKHLIINYELEEEDDDGTECSGQTKVASPQRPPIDASQEEWNKYYWEICYGHNGYCEVTQPPTVQKSLPAKSCLSSKKTINRPTENASSVTPRRILHKSPSFDKSYSMSSNEECSKDDTTPKNNVTQLATTSSSSLTITRGQSAVKFGANSAAEFDLEMPSTEMKPMPFSVVQKFFPIEKLVDNSLREEQFSLETKRNVSTLAEWDDDFDSIISQDNYDDNSYDEEEDNEGESAAHQLPKRRRKQTPYKEGLRHRRRGNPLARPRKCRRDSSIFGSAEKGRSLLDISDETDEEESSSGLPFSVTIHPDEYTSPSSHSLNDTMSCIDSPAATNSNMQDTRESTSSLSSACISPSSLRSESILSAAGSRSTCSNKETPKSARTSSSTILKTVHASGAFHPTNSPQGGELMPNQLKYSPKGSTTGPNASPSPSSSSSSDSIDSYIMSLFTKHSLEDETDISMLGKQLSILSTHPMEGFQISMSDFAKWIAASGKRPSQFVDDHFSTRLNLSASLNLLNETDIDNKASSMFCGASSQWINSVLAKDKVSFMERCLEVILRNHQNATNANEFCKDRGKVTVDADEQTIASCLKILEGVSSFWSSSVELACAELALEKFESMSEDVLKAARQNLTLFDGKLRKATSMMTSGQILTSRKMKMMKRKASSQASVLIERIKRLEDDVLQETERLNVCKSVRDVLLANLDIERACPIAAIAEEIRSTILPSLVSSNGSDFTFAFLDGLAEFAIKVALDDETLENIKIGCFFKDDGGVSVKLLKAVLLGYTELDPDQGHGPFLIRNSLQSIIRPSYLNKSMPSGLRELFFDATQILFKIDTLVRTVRMLECENMLTFDCYQGDVTLSTYLTFDDNVIRIEFLFRNLLLHSWNFTTIPDDVTVTMAQGENNANTTGLSQLQEQARHMLKAEYRDPSLLRRICDEVMGTVCIILE